MKKLSFLWIVLLLAAAHVALAQPASWTPVQPRVGDVVTIYYDSRVGSLGPSTSTLWLHWGVYDPGTSTWSTPAEGMWPAGSHLFSDHVAVESPMTRGTDTVWSVTIDFDTSVHDIAFVFTDGANNWDNNNNHNWIINFATPGAVCWWYPSEPVPSDTVTIWYDAVPGTLPNNVTNVTLHWGVNETSHGAWQLPPQAIWPAGTIAMGQAAETPLTPLGASVFRIIIPTIDSIRSLHWVFTDGTNWDNNSNRNWDLFLTAPPVPVFTHRIFRYDPRSAFASVIPGNINTVALAGTFNNWSTSATPLSAIDPYGNHFGEVAIPVGTTNYKFVINGSNWQTDPDNPRNNSNDNNNSMITVAADSFPQIFNIQPGENLVYPAATNNVVVAVTIRPGDVGPGISGTPVARVNGSIWPANWNAATSLLTLNALPGAAGVCYVQVSATDSAGRIGTRNLTYGFRDQGYLAVDPMADNNYRGPSGPDSTFDLLGMLMTEYSGGDSIHVNVGLKGIDLQRTMVVLTISGTLDGYGPVPGLSSEVNVPNLASGGVSLLLLDPSSPFYLSSIHNRLHPAGDLAHAGPTVHFSQSGTSYIATIAKADLEQILGSYQTAWYYTCASYRADNAAAGYCTEVGSDIGGTDGDEDPDAIDMLFSYAADVEQKMFHNYGLTRRMTLDAPGRGVAGITPQEIGPHIASPGPLCRILTQGAPTTNGSQTVVARVTPAATVTSVWLMQNSTRIPVTMVADSFVVPVTLAEGANQFAAWAVDASGDTGHSPTLLFTLNLNHTPIISLTTRVEGMNCVLDASATTDPEQQTVNFVWTADATNPAPVALENPNSPVCQFSRPGTPGEYYFNLTASDPDGHTRQARTFFTINADSAHGFQNNECADWVKNAMIYEIFVRSYSANSNLQGVTADMDRIAGLGVNCIWMMPIFEGPSDHGYEITDYYHIEQDYGNEADLHALVQAAHAHGIKVVLDMVLNHTSISHPFMQDAMRHGRYSHYWNWYDRDANGNYTYYYDWTSLPNLNLNNPECAAYFIDMCKYWITDFDIDGYRCDVAWGPQQRSPQFWVQWRSELKKIKPEVLLLAEADASSFPIYDNRFDLAFDWNLHHQGTSSFANMFPQIPGFENLTQLITNYGVWWPAFKNPLRFMENHDEARFISVNTPDQTKLVASFMMNLPGAVMLYAGQEIGTTSQRGLPAWGTDPNNMFTTYYRLTQARRLLPAMRTGSFAQLSNSQGSTCYSFARFGPGMDPVVWVGDFAPNGQVVSVSVNLAQLGLHADSTYTVSELLGNTNYTALGSQITSLVSSVSAYQSRVWVISDHAISVDVPPSRSLIPEKTRLGAAYPNPFNPSTILPLELSTACRVTLKIYDVLGREVATVIDANLDPGMHTIIWDGKSSGHEVGSGIYFAVMQAGRVHQVQKLVLMR